MPCIQQQSFIIMTQIHKKMNYQYLYTVCVVNEVNFMKKSNKYIYISLNINKYIYESVYFIY